MPGAAGSGFDVDHLPYGVFATGDGPARVGVRIGDLVLDAESVNVELDSPGVWWSSGSLKPVLTAGPAGWAAARSWLTALLSDSQHRGAVEPHLYPVDEVTLHPPFEVRDYVDFYASEHHASAVGRIFRPGSDPLPPNWKHLPIGYHGRAQTIVPSGTGIVRPCGQLLPPGADAPVFGASERLDIEAELGFVVGAGSTPGVPVPASAFPDMVFGVTLVNDWSARDIQAWEYRPLGPFLGKSFATSLSPWVTPLAALAAARVAPPPRTVPLLGYLADDPDQPWGLDIALQVEWNGTVVSRPPYSAMYFTPAQMLAHLTVNGATVSPGDLYASGTISGPEHDQAGSFLELSRGGTEPVRLADGTSRTFLADGDTVTISATAPTVSGGRLHLGSVTGTILPARV